MSKEIIRSVIDRVLWTAGATEWNRDLLTDAISEALAAAPQVVADEADLECQVPPFGWRCTRGAGHPGPCAAVECHEDVAAVELGMSRLAAAPVQAQEPVAVVYPPDGTVSPFTVINLGHGLVKMGDSLHDGRLPALWFGKDGLGMGVSEEMNRAAKEGETLAVVTFSNVEGLDVLSEVVQRIRSVSFPGSPVQPVAVPDGWKLVPIKLTTDMICAGAMADPERQSLWEVYLAACPAAPAAQGDDKELTIVELHEAYYAHSGNSKIDYDGREWGDFVGGWESAIAAKAVTP